MTTITIPSSLSPPPSLTLSYPILSQTPKHFETRRGTPKTNHQKEIAMGPRKREESDKQSERAIQCQSCQDRRCEGKHTKI
jgi:hypothetical protein